MVLVIKWWFLKERLSENKRVEEIVKLSIKINFFLKIRVIRNWMIFRDFIYM